MTIQTIGMKFTRTIEEMGRRRHIQHAASSAHTIWSKRYTTWSESYFDEHFLRTRVQPLFLRSHMQTTPISLANLWADQFALSEERRQELVVEFTAAAADFLYLFDSELRALTRRPKWKSNRTSIQSMSKSPA